MTYPGTPAAAAPERAGPAVTVSVRVRGGLNGVTATSARRAWAVGESVNAKTLVVRWNGTAWRRLPSPSRGDIDSLASVAATSARRAWAVGFASGGNHKVLIERWNGAIWK